jgi:hypothetical protein
MKPLILHFWYLLILVVITVDGNSSKYEVGREIISP